MSHRTLAASLRRGEAASLSYLTPAVFAAKLKCQDAAIGQSMGRRAAGHVSPHVITMRANGDAEDWRREWPRTLSRVLMRAKIGNEGEICIAAGGIAAA